MAQQLQIQKARHNSHIQITQYFKINRGMFQSFSKNNGLNLRLQCFRCHNKVQDQFVLLLCDHVICASCLQDITAEQQTISNPDYYDGIRCVCGVISCFRTGTTTIDVDSRINSHITHGGTVSVNIHQTNRNQRNSANRSTRPSVGLIHSKNTTSTKNLSRILNIESQIAEGLEPSTLNQESIEEIKKSRRAIGNIKSIESSKRVCAKDKIQQSNTQGNERQRFMLQRSKYPIQSIRKLQQHVQKQRERQNIEASLMMNKKKKRHRNQVNHYQPKYIDSESIADQSVTNENNNPNWQKQPRSYLKFHDQQNFQGDSERETITRERSFNVSNQFGAELSFLKLTHKKNLDTLERAYMQAKQRINKDYQKLQNSLRDLCLQNFVGRQNNSHVDLGKLIKKRYETCVGDPLERIIKSIKAEQTGLSSELLIGDNLRPTRFSSPEWKGNRLVTQPASIYSPKTRCYENSECGEMRKYEIKSTHTPLNQLGYKLQKRGKRRTNIVIQI